MTVRREILLLVYGLSFLIILVMSGTYAVFFTRQMKEHSRTQVIETFDLIFDDINSRAQTFTSEIEHFAQTTLIGPMYVIQLFEEQYAQPQQANNIRTIKKIMPQISTLVNEIRKFNVHMAAAEITLYKADGTLLAFYQKFDEREMVGAYLAEVDPEATIDVPAGDDGFMLLQRKEDIPRRKFPDGLPKAYQGPFPEKLTVKLTAVDQKLALTFTTPIERNGGRQGIGVFQLEFDHADVERYSRLTRTKVNLFAGNRSTVGTLKGYTTMSNELLETYHSIDLSQEAEVPTITFSDMTLEGQQYYQGTLALGNGAGPVGAITVHFPRALEEQRRAQFMTMVLIIACLVFLLSAIGAGLLSAVIVRPLKHLTTLLRQVTQGDLTGITGDETSGKRNRSRSEINQLLDSFYAMIRYLRDMATVAEGIARGEIGQRISPRGPKDLLGNAFCNMTSYLQGIGTAATRVAQGDLRNQMPPRSSSDQLGNAFTQMQAGLFNLISQIHSEETQLNAISAQVLNASTQNTQALERIENTAVVTSSAMQQVNSGAEDVQKNTAHLASAVEETSSSMNQMVSSITHVADNTKKLSEFADTSSAIMLEIVNSLEKVTEQAEGSRTFAETVTQDAISGQESVEQMILRMNTIADVTRNLSDIIARLEHRSQDIGTILDVIEDVAEQTSLLALNASIIAAQAGSSHGRAFAVVADEIKGLATRVGQSTKEIARIVRVVQHDSSEAVSVIAQGHRDVEGGVSAAYNARTALEQIRQSADESSQMTAEMADSIRQQTSAHTHIVESIRDVNNMISEITRATQEQKLNSAQLMTVMENMRELASQVSFVTQEQQESIQHVATFMDDVRVLVENTSNTVQQLAETSQALTDQSDVLQQHVARFMLPHSATPVETGR